MKDLRHTLQYLLAGIALALLSAAVMPIALAADKPGDSAANKDPVLRDDAKCTKCHDESWPKPILSIYQTRHGVKADGRTPGCQSCHGASDSHLKNPGSSPDVVFSANSKNASSAQDRNAVCLTCHEAGKRTHWDGSKHQSENLACTNCHAVHTPNDKVLSKATQPEVCFACHKTERAQTHRISTHPLAAGKMGCSSCHNPHGSTGPKLLVKDSVNDTCYTCHAEKRGPFLFEHSPVVDDCTNCHTPHGSTTAPLLKARSPYLCQECHSGDHGNQVNSAANLQSGNVTTVNGINPPANAAARAQLGARACLNCHVQIHGSNSPAGAKFQR
jgi:DmsE family decaheme c-type cytochrome